MNTKKILDSFEIFNKCGDLVKFQHLLESKFEKYDSIITINIGSFKYPNYVNRKVTGIADNSTYLINEDDDFRLVYDKGIEMFNLTLKNGILVSESALLSPHLVDNKRDLIKVIELLKNKLYESNRDHSSHF